MYRVNRVDRLPVVLDENVVYVSEEYGLAALKCACGCGHRVTLLLGDGHRVNELGGLADISPSIGVWDAACRSHFWIRHGKVVWGEEFSEAEIRAAMDRQLDNHLERGALREPWWKRLAAWVVNVFRQRG
jgi:Family of unknown function (DUF6527)